MWLQRKGTRKTQNISVEGKERRKRNLEEEAHPSWHAPFSPFLTLCSLCLWGVGGFPGPGFHLVHCLTSPSAYSVAFIQKPFLTKPGQCWPSLPLLQMPHPLVFFSRQHLSHHLTYDILILTCYVLFVSSTRMSALQVQDFGVFFFTAEFPVPTQCIAHSLSSFVNIWGMNK